MGCGSTIDALGSQVIVTRWMSTTQATLEQTAGHIATFAGLLTELQQLGEATLVQPNYKLQASPYPARLRPLTNLERLHRAACVTLVRIEFMALDTTISGGTGQHADTLTAITDSITAGSGSYTLNDAYMQARYRYTAIAGWQPNGFRPIVKVNGTQMVFQDLLQSELGTTLADSGDAALGLDLPFCLEGNISLGKVETLEIEAMAYQYITETTRFQRYPILCTAIFTIC